MCAAVTRHSPEARQRGGRPQPPLPFSCQGSSRSSNLTQGLTGPQYLLCPPMPLHPDVALSTTVVTHCQVRTDPGGWAGLPAGHSFCKGRTFVKANSEPEMRPSHAPVLRVGRGLRSIGQQQPWA